MTDATALAGVPLRDQDVRFDVSPTEAVAASRTQRTRLLETVRGLTAQEWTAQSRCSEWSVQDVVRHLVHVNRIQLAAMAAARAGERFTGFAPGVFDAKVTPNALLREAGEESVDATLASYAASLDELFTTIDRLPADPDSLLCATPAGRQPWHRAILHGLFDSAVHERDILVPLGRWGDPPPPADEVRAIASYQVLLTARVLALLGVPVDLALTLDGGPALRVLVDGPLVSVSSGNVDGARTRASGEVAVVLDAMVGRGSLPDVVDGPAEVALGLGALSSLV